MLSEGQEEKGGSESENVHLFVVADLFAELFRHQLWSDIFGKKKKGKGTISINEMKKKDYYSMVCQRTSSRDSARPSGQCQSLITWRGPLPARSSTTGYFPA